MTTLITNDDELLPPNSGEELLRPNSIVNNRYKVLNIVGRGVNGIIARVADQALNDEICALKLLVRRLGQGQTQLVRFRNEVLLARKLSHPNITRVYDFGEAEPGCCYLTMEYVKGIGLNQRIYGARQAPLSFPEILKLLHEICSGLGFAHSQGVIHRDLKPDNVLLGDEGEIKLTDFGLARALTREKGPTGAGQTVGTPLYMAPEQLRGEKTDPRADIYAFGILAFELAAKKLPFYADDLLDLTESHHRQPIPQISVPGSNIPLWYQFFVEKCAAKKKTDRFSNFEEVSKVLLRHIKEANGDRPTGIFQVSPNRTVQSSVRFDSVSSVASTNQRPVELRRTVLFICFGLLALYGLIQNTRLGYWASVLTLKSEQLLGTNLYPIRLVLKKPAQKEKYFSYLKNGEIIQAAMLLDAGVWQPNATSPENISALDIAIGANQQESVSLLLQHGADVNLRDPSGVTPLMHAVENGNVRILSLLLQQSADLNAQAINAQDSEGQTAIMYAILAGDTNTVRTLLSAGASISTPVDIRGRNALMLAVQSEEIPILRLLLKKISSKDVINAADHQGKTALVYAVELESDSLVRLLLAHGANPNQPDKQGRTPYGLASQKIRVVFKTFKL